MSKHKTEDYKISAVKFLHILIFMKKIQCL